MNSYSFRCLFLWPARQDQTTTYVYEERITLWRAAGLDEASLLAEDEAKSYARDNDFELLDFWQLYWLVDAVTENGIEVFSLLRGSNLAADEYIKTFFETGAEYQHE